VFIAKHKIMIRKIFIITTLIFSLASCTKDFDKVNINPTTPSTVPLDYLLGQTQLQIAGSAGDPGYHTWRANLIYGMNAIQLFASTSTFYAGDKYLYQADLSEAYFLTAYPSSIKNLVNLIELAKVDPANVNILSIARILKAFQFHIITDLYGDVPYSEAGLGFYTSNFSPKYDEQKDIYADLLKELEEAGAALSTTAYTPTAADYVYSGDITKWKKFANSMMLRLAMRMTKVDPAAAQAWAAKAIAGGVMSDNSETFAIKHSGGQTASMNANSFNLGGPNRQEVSKGSIQWSKTLIDKMKARVDPRVSVIATLKDGNTSFAAQKGLPNGLDGNTLAGATGETTPDAFSRPRSIIYDVEDPNMFFTHAEARFLKAEAIERGWAAGSAAAEYAAGQAAALAQMASYGDGASISATDIAAYQAANPYPAAGTFEQKMTQIHDELFILWGSTFNGYEAWASWRRSGYPALTPTNYPGNVTNGTIMRRLRFPQSEEGINPNYRIAVERMGGDLFTTRVWWDKP
jgi:hypothetical protein